MKFLSLPIVLSAMMLLTSCSGRVTPPTVRPPVSLLVRCPPLPPLPQPMTDPDRADWERDIMAAYALCAARVVALINAVPPPGVE